MLEKRWAAVLPQSFIANGTVDGEIKVSDSSLFKVKQQIIVKSNSIPSRNDLEIKRITDVNTVYVGLQKNNIDHRQDMSLYLVADGATIEAIEQKRSSVPEQEIERLTYEEEPVVARRVVIVDPLGKIYNNENPIPVNASVSIGDVNVDINFDPNNPNDPNNSDTGAYLRAPNGDLVTVTQDGAKRSLDVNDSTAQTLLQSILTQLASVLDVSDSATHTSLQSIITQLSGTLDVNDTATQTILSNILVQLSGTLDVNDTATQTILSAIQTLLTSIEAGTPDSLGQKIMANSQSVVIASDQTPIPISGNITATLGDEPIKISVTQNGAANGPEYNFVYNLRQQILATHDRNQQITYADFGTKDQRITRIDYSSPTFPGFVARKDIAYTLQGGKYRRDSITWSIV